MYIYPFVVVSSARVAAAWSAEALGCECKQAPTRLQQLKAHKLSDVAVSLLQRLTGSENVGINAEWLKLQPWTSDASMRGRAAEVLSRSFRLDETAGKGFHNFMTFHPDVNEL